MNKVERLLNLIGLLLDTRRPLTSEEIRRKIRPYREQSDVAFRRMFERDKEELRELGLPLERAATDAWEVEEGYLIRPTQALLDDPGLTADEQAALWLAASAWGETGASPTTALLKLGLVSEGGDHAPPGWMLPRIEPGGPALETLVDAAIRRKSVVFSYRSASGSAAERRTVDPYLVMYRGAWYVVGHDHSRGEVRRFKLTRIEGAVEITRGRGPDFDAPSDVRGAVPHGPWEGATEARVAFSPDAVWWAERTTGARRVVERADGWVEVTLPFADREFLAGWIVGFGDRAELVAPEDLRALVVQRLEAIAARFPAPGPEPGDAPDGGGA